MESPDPLHGPRALAGVSGPFTPGNVPGTVRKQRKPQAKGQAMATDQTPELIGLTHSEAHEFGATNARGTCKWCGRKLRRSRVLSELYKRELIGGYGDGAFCGLRCGYAFALRFVSLGSSLRMGPK